MLEWDLNSSKEGLDNKHSRVWSWLRMNAGGVHNTFKSNEALEMETSVKVNFDLVADGWVTREQLALAWGITFGNER